MERIYNKVMEIGMDRLIIIERWRGGPGTIKLYVSPFTSETFSTFYIESCKTQDEVGQRRTINEGLIITLEKNASLEVRCLADLFSKFLRIPSVEELPKDTSFKASMHLSSFRGGKVKIAFTMPPMVSETGPTLIVKYQTDN